LTILPDDEIVIKPNLGLQELCSIDVTAGFYQVQGSIYQGISGS
jgi:hypothetical protein